MDKLIPDEIPAPAVEFVLLSSLPNDSELFGDPPSKALIESVRSFGLLQPIVVIETKLGRASYLLAAGRRRVKAAREAGLLCVPAMVYEAGVVNIDSVALIENELRSKNVLSDLVAIERLVKQGADYPAISLATGMSVATIKSRMRLSSLSSILRDALQCGQMSCTVAEAVAKLSPDLQERLEQVLVENGKLTLADVKQVRSVRAANAVASLPDELFDGDDDAPTPTPPIPFVSARETALRAALERLESACCIVGVKRTLTKGEIAEIDAARLAAREAIGGYAYERAA